jgi:hypothetical protein
MNVLVILGYLIGDMPRDCFTLAVRIGRKIDLLLALRRFFQIINDFFLCLDDMEVGRKIFLDVDTEFAFGQIDDMAYGGFDLIVSA